MISMLLGIIDINIGQLESPRKYLSLKVRIYTCIPQMTPLYPAILILTFFYFINSTLFLEPQQNSLERKERV